MAEPGDNINEAKKVILRVALEIERLEAEKADLGDRIRDEKKKIKDLGIKMADFNAVRRIWRLDELERRESIHGVAVVAEALGVSLQGDLFADGGDDIFGDEDIDEDGVIQDGEPTELSARILEAG